MKSNLFFYLTLFLRIFQIYFRDKSVIMEETQYELKDKQKRFLYTCMDCDHEWYSTRNTDKKCKECGSRSFMVEDYENEE